MSPVEERVPPCRFVVTADGDLHAEDTPQNREIARRVRACVNACAGITTEDLENGVVADMRRAIAGIAPLLRETESGLRQRIESHREAGAA
jgi:hypothetical protein